MPGGFICDGEWIPTDAELDAQRARFRAWLEERASEPDTAARIAAAYAMQARPSDPRADDEHATSRHWLTYTDD